MGSAWRQSHGWGGGVSGFEPRTGPFMVTQSLLAPPARSTTRLVDIFCRLECECRRDWPWDSPNLWLFLLSCGLALCDLSSIQSCTFCGFRMWVWLLLPTFAARWTSGAAVNGMVNQGSSLTHPTALNLCGCGCLAAQGAECGLVRYRNSENVPRGTTTKAG